MNLRWNGHPSAHVIAFYGGFIRGTTHNLILEYADLGNLEHFIQHTEAPSTGQDIINFWERFLNVTHGVIAIQSTLLDENTSIPRILLG